MFIFYKIICKSVCFFTFIDGETMHRISVSYFSGITNPPSAVTMSSSPVPTDLASDTCNYYNSIYVCCTNFIYR